eukprot:g9979.t1
MASLTDGALQKTKNKPCLVRTPVTLKKRKRNIRRVQFAGDEAFTQTTVDSDASSLKGLVVEANEEFNEKELHMFRYLDILRNARMAFPEVDIVNMSIDKIETELSQNRIRFGKVNLRPYLTRDRLSRISYASMLLETEKDRYQGDEDYDFHRRYIQHKDVIRMKQEELEKLSWNELLQKCSDQNKIDDLETKRATKKRRIGNLKGKQLKKAYQKARDKKTKDGKTIPYLRKGVDQKDFLTRLEDERTKSELILFLAKGILGKAMWRSIQENYKIHFNEILKAEVQKLKVEFEVSDLAKNTNSRSSDEIKLGFRFLVNEEHKLLVARDDLLRVIREGRHTIASSIAENETFLAFKEVLEKKDLRASRCMMRNISSAQLGLKDSGGNTLLHIAAKHGYTNYCSRMLDKNGSIVNYQRKDGDTALHKAAQYGHCATMQLLLERGADATIKNEESRTPLQAMIANFIEEEK